MFHTLKTAAICLLLSMALLSCIEKPVKKSPVLPKEKMIAVLIDIHFAEAAVTAKNWPPDSVRFFINQYYAQIFNLHGIDAKQFYQSFEYYLKHPEKMDALYQDMIIEMSKKEEELRIK